MPPAQPPSCPQGPQRHHTPGLRAQTWVKGALRANTVFLWTFWKHQDFLPHEGGLRPGIPWPLGPRPQGAPRMLTGQGVIWLRSPSPQPTSTRLSQSLTSGLKLCVKNELGGLREGGRGWPW